jgi:hypothetical protein
MNFSAILATVERRGEVGDEEQLPSPLLCTSYGKSLESDRLANSWKVRTLRHRHHFHLSQEMIMRDSEK